MQINFMFYSLYTINLDKMHEIRILYRVML